MTQSNNSKPILDNSFSAFIAGLTVGIAGVLLLGTEEGKKISQKVIQSIPEELTNLFSHSNSTSTSTPPPPQVTPSPRAHTNTESPPPPPPSVKPTHSPAENFFSSNGNPLK